MDCWLLLLQLLPLLAIVYFYYRKTVNYWPSRGIRGPTPLPLIGNFLEIVWKTQPKAELDWYRKYGKVYGSYQGDSPVLTILDNELIKTVLVKDFSNFVNRRSVPVKHEIWSRNLFLMENEDWKRVRAITSPSFTSGKLKGMNALMNQCVDKLTGYLDNLCTSGNGILKTKEIVSGFTIDVIASTSFATETNSNDDRTKENPFVYHGMRLLIIPIWRLFSFLIIPNKIRKLFKMELSFKPEHFNFFRDLAKNVVDERRRQSSSARKRNDLVQLLMDASISEKDMNASYDKLTADMEHEDETPEKEQQNGKHGKLVKPLDENEIIAQCILFFIAGFETTATSITHCLFELASNPEIQDRLHEELELALAGQKVNSEQYYETVMARIPYLDGVIKETLRKYPPVIRLERRVNISGYKLGGVELEKEQAVNIPTFAVHRVPEYYPDPERFNPERFLPENKEQLVPYTYLPFGAGPRNCIGMRFAYQEIKLLLAKLITQFEFSPAADTPTKLEFQRMGILSSKPFQLKVSKRA